MGKLIILPSLCDSLGGATVSLSMTIAGFARLQSLDRICVLVKSDSLLESYLQHLGQAACLQTIPAANGHQFYRRALDWVNQQPQESPLLLENCTSRYLLPILGRNILRLKLSGRQIYHVFRDSADSRNLGGKWLRRIIFSCLDPEAICNSQFTAESVTQHLGLKVVGILYPPVDRQRFCDRPVKTSPPSSLKPIIDSGAKILLTPSRIGEPRQINDKNLRGLIWVLAKLKNLGHDYHGVIIGQDYSANKSNSRSLLEMAQQLNISDRLTILPPSFVIEDYYQYADVVVTLAPREPFGRTVVEAISCGVPVVGSNSGGIGEILANFAPHWTVDPWEPTATAETIIRLAEDGDRATLLQGKKWVEAYCSPLEYATKMMEIIGLSATNQKQNTSTLAAK